LAVGLAAAGAILAVALAGSRWSVVGAAIGAVSGAFAPSAYAGLLDRSVRREAWRGTIEVSPPRSLARLLDPRREVVAFIGRHDELDALVAWCEDPAAIRLRLVTGPGGVGKTRLAVELADRLRKMGWVCERVADGKETNAISVLRQASKRNALLVIDYAETRTGLSQLTSELADPRGTDVRVLLLARSGGDWWDQLGIENPAVWDLVQAARLVTIELPAVVTHDLSDAEVVAMAVRSFARELNLPERVVKIRGGPSRRRVLDLHTAALVAVLGEVSGETVQIDINEVLMELLRHEQHYWYQSAAVFGLGNGRGATTPRILRQVIAAACLLGAATEKDACGLPKRASGMSRSQRVAEWLRLLYPPDPDDTDWIGSLQPDRLAELHAVQELMASPRFARACLIKLNPRQALRAVTLLARASSDYQGAQEFLKQMLPSVTDIVTDLQGPIETLTAIYNAIPSLPGDLASVAATLSQRIIDLLPTDAGPSARAFWLNQLGIRFWQLGRWAEALAAEQEAIEIYRDLDASAPDRYHPGLANSLAVLSIWFWQQDHRAEALAAEQEAIEIYRELAAYAPSQYGLHLATNLSSLGAWLWQVGRAAEALPIAQEAIEVYRELAAARPDRYRPDLFRNLRILASIHEALDQIAEANAIREEVAKLADAQPNVDWGK